MIKKIFRVKIRRTRSSQKMMDLRMFLMRLKKRKMFSSRKPQRQRKPQIQRKL